jgi:hypothetical protein
VNVHPPACRPYKPFACLPVRPIACLHTNTVNSLLPAGLPKYTMHILLPLQFSLPACLHVHKPELEFLKSLWGQGTEFRNRVIVPARQATYAGEIHSLESIPGFACTLYNVYILLYSFCQTCIYLLLSACTVHILPVCKTCRKYHS